MLYLIQQLTRNCNALIRMAKMKKRSCSGKGYLQHTSNQLSSYPGQRTPKKLGKCQAAQWKVANKCLKRYLTSQKCELQQDTKMR